MRLSNSQNFLISRSLVRSLINKSSIISDDLVLEIGAGLGIITSELGGVSRRVLAFEADRNIFLKVSDKVKLSNVEIICVDFMLYDLPKGRYKVFSNIPFSITSDILRKLFFSSNPPLDSYLILQKEAAWKWAGISRESLISILNKPFFRLEIVHKFKKSDFRPIPSVDTVMMRVVKLREPLIIESDEDLFRDFVSYGYTKFKPTLKKSYSKILSHVQFLRLAYDLGFSQYAKPTDLDFEQWLGMFLFFKSETKKHSLVSGEFARLISRQAKLDKRTRTSLEYREKYKNGK